MKPESRKFSSAKVRAMLIGFEERQKQRNTKKDEKKPKMSKYYHNFYKALKYGELGT